MPQQGMAEGLIVVRSTSGEVRERTERGLYRSA